jgi:hypothetical protein
VWGTGDIAPRVLISALVGGEWSASRLRPHYPLGKSPPPPRYTLDRRLGGPQSQTGRYGEQKTFHCLESNPGPSLYRFLTSNKKLMKSVNFVSNNTVFTGTKKNRSNVLRFIPYTLLPYNIELIKKGAFLSQYSR